MKKYLSLLPLVLCLTGCAVIENSRFEDEYNQMIEEAGLIGTRLYSKLMDDLWEGEKHYECFIQYKTVSDDEGKFCITGATIPLRVKRTDCQTHLENLKYYIEHKKTKAQQNRENTEKQKVIQARKQEEKDKAYAKEQYKLAQQTHDSKERLSHLENASASGNPQASYDLFKYYLPVNELLADEYLKKAAFDGHAEANLIMGGRFAKSAKYRFSDNIHAYVYYKRAERYGNKTGATLAKGIENRFKARIQQGNSEAEYLWRNAQRMASF